MSSTDQTQKSRTIAAAGTPESPVEPTRSTPKLDLSPTKITGGALAAMTAAALGAQLSVVGTVIGAAVASVIAAIASALYTTSLERTGHRVRRVWQRGDTPLVIAPAGPEPVDAVPEPAVPDPADSPTRRRLSWSSVLVGALVAFGLAAAVLTGIELITGQALSGGDGTTVSQVSGGDDRPKAPAESPSPTSEQTPSDEPTSSPTAEALPSESSTPVPKTEPTGTQTAPVPTETQTEPSPSAPPTSTESEAVTPGP